MRTLNITFTHITVVSLIIGGVIGFLAQRSRMCFIGGWRDFFLIRDKYLLKGFFSFLISAAIFFFIFSFAGNYLKDYPWYARAPLVFDPIDLNPFETVLPEAYRNMSYCDMQLAPVFLTVGEDIPIRGLNLFGFKISNEILLTLGATLLLGFFSTLANGCPMRQHVMASSGNVTAMCYLVGFYIAVVVYDEYLVDFMNSLVNAYNVLAQ